MQHSKVKSDLICLFTADSLSNTDLLTGHEKAVVTPSFDLRVSVNQSLSFTELPEPSREETGSLLLTLQVKWYLYLAGNARTGLNKLAVSRVRVRMQ
jgi:hypothetical protein